MKKAVLLLAILMMAQASFAYMQEYTTADMKTLHGTGFSQETMQIVDKARMLSQGYEKDYVPFYSRKLYPDNVLAKWYKLFNSYIDPAEPENNFGAKEVHYENTWFQFSPSYLKKDGPNDFYERFYDKDIKRLEVAGKRVKGSNGIEPAIDDVPADTSNYVMEDL